MLTDDDASMPRTQALSGASHQHFFTRRCVMCAVSVRRCGMTVTRMLFTICVGLHYLSLILSHREPSSPDSQDLRTAQHSHAPVRAVRKTQSLLKPLPPSLNGSLRRCFLHGDLLVLTILAAHIHTPRYDHHIDGLCILCFQIFK